MKILVIAIISIVAIVFLQACKEKKKLESVKIVITKLRTRADLAKKLSNIMQDSTNAYVDFLTTNDSLLTLGKDTNTFMSSIIPNTYEVFKGTEPKKVLKKIMDYEKKFWNEARSAKAIKLGYTPLQVYTIASIVEEETTRDEDKGKIASVYMNRLKTGMKLEADPTLKFAINDFSLTRIYLKHKDMAATSPYSTYANKGLPPGPICTPSIKTIDAVLNAPDTDAVFFVAQPNFSGLSNFTKDYKVHLQNAAIYHKFLDSIAIAKKNSKL
jgi:UPF0755 protein